MGYLKSNRRKCLWLVGCFITFAESKFSSGEEKVMVVMVVVFIQIWNLELVWKISKWVFIFVPVKKDIKQIGEK